MKAARDDIHLLENAAKSAALRGQRRFTRFLDPAERREAEALAAREGMALACWGGYRDAERRIGCFHSPGDEPEEADYPMVCLRSGVDARQGALTHRDVLGAFMALGLTRDCLGDIITEDASVALFVHAQLAEYVAEQLQSAGHVRLQLAPAPAGFRPPEPTGTYFRAVVPSLRLDVVLAAGYHLSRSRAQELIRAGRVKVEHLPCDRTDHPVAPGSMLSVQGVGRVRFTSRDGVTRKDNLGVTFFRYE